MPAVQVGGAEGDGTMKPPDFAPGSDLLVGVNGNAFAVMGAVERHLLKAGADGQYVQAVLDDARSDDYEHLLMVCVAAMDGQWQKFYELEAINDQEHGRRLN
jgi:hypothetical protein